VPALISRRQYTLGEAKKAALNMFDQQLEVARAHTLHSPEFSATKNGSKVVVLHCMEYKGEILQDEIDRARSEVADAFDNLVKMRDLFALLKSSQKLIAQRALTFTHSGVTVRAVPDLIAFYKNEAPLIVDWKVHVFGVREAWLQLAVYSQALLRCKPHVDFPTDLGRWVPTDVRLIEAQLLTKTIRQYSLSNNELDRSEAYIAESATQILLTIGDREKSSLEASDFRVTSTPDACQRCAFRRICWQEEE
jgi:hypothetical protein